jgi:hypothetical protein
MRGFYETVIQPILPKHMDENEWLVAVITLLISYGVFIITQKKRLLLWTEIICIYLFNLLLTTIGDYFLAMPPYDFYDTVDRNSGELADLFLQNIVYPGTLLIIIHLYKTFKPNLILFIFLTGSLLTILETISVYVFHLYEFKTWKSYYSLIFYFFVIGINLLFYHRLDYYIFNRTKQREKIV